mgnify:FL=1|jgi:hypothetical protein|nr:MAG TPA: hypothetical protein [Bacteriophage sp.]
MRLIDADSLLEKWNNLSEKDRTRFDRVILCQPIVDTIVVTERKKHVPKIDFDDFEDNRPECCKVHDKYFSTCDTCEYGEYDEEEEDSAAIDFYTGIANMEWHDLDGRWKKSPLIKKIVVCAENKEVAKEKLILSVNSINEEMKMAGERYVLDENSIKKAYGLISAGDVILD